MKTGRIITRRAFTLMEMLVVISIIAVVAGLVVGLAKVAGGRSKISRTETELKSLETMIEAYKAKVGVYPPDNPAAPGVNSLLYELAGAVRNGPQNNPTYETTFGSIQSNVIATTFGRNGLINAGETNGITVVDILEGDTRRHKILKSLKPDQIRSVAPNTLSIVVPVDDANGNRPNPWKYLQGANAVHNPESFDLWVEITAGGQTRTIGNWKN